MSAAKSILMSACLLSFATSVIAGRCEVRLDDVNFFRDEAKAVAVSSKLQFNKALMREKIDVKVSGRVAILSGNVSSKAAIRRAVQIAQRTGGIRCVQNWLKVGPPIRDIPLPGD